jgi:hypothetical protein
MHIEVRDHAAIDKLLFDEIAGERDALFLFISRGIENSTSRASCASLRFSPASTSFHRVSRSFKRSGAPSGSMISEWTTPALFEKSWSRPAGHRAAAPPRDRQRSQPRSIRSRG